MPRPFCRNVQVIQSVDIYKGDHVGIVMVILGILYFISSFIILYFIRIQEQYARRGNDVAVKAVIFPVFVYVLWVNAF
eukprot:gene42436-51841_t